MGVELKPIMEHREIALAEVKGKLAVDAFNTLYQFLTTIRQPDGTPLMDGEGRITSHLSGLFYRTCSLLEKGVFPVMVFDGAPSELKSRTIAERSERKHEAEREMLEAREKGDVARAAMLAQRTVRLTKDMILESKKLLELMGLPFVQAPSEGEAECAAMAKQGVVKATASQDFDSLLFGTPVLIRNLTISGKRKVPRTNVFVDVKPEEYILKDDLEKLGITQEKLIWIGVLAGTDFNKGIFGIGPKKALKLVKEHDSLPSILKKLNQEMDFEPVVELFEKPNVKRVEARDLQLKELSRDKLIEFMHDEHDFSLDRINSSLAKAFNEPLDSNQANLKKWF